MATYVYGNGGAMSNPNVTVDNLPIKKDMYAFTRECNIWEETFFSHKDNIVRYWEAENAMIYGYKGSHVKKPPFHSSDLEWIEGGKLFINFLDNIEKSVSVDLRAISYNKQKFDSTWGEFVNETEEIYPFTYIGDIII